MSTTFGLPDSEDVRLLDHAMREWHPRLAQAEVRVALLLAEGGGLKDGKYQVAFRVDVVPLDYRILLTPVYDARVKIDRDVWEAFDQLERLALLDSALAFLDVTEKDGPNASVVIERDDIDRPKLKIIKGDWYAGPGHTNVVARQGELALDYRNARSVAAKAAAAIELGRR